MLQAAYFESVVAPDWLTVIVGEIVGLAWGISQTSRPTAHAVGLGAEFEQGPVAAPGATRSRPMRGPTAKGEGCALEPGDDSEFL